VDLDGVPHLMGRLWARTRKNKESAFFEYDKTWLENPARFSLEPALQVGPGPFHTPADTPMFGAIGDSAPDRWGRALMRRMERRRGDLRDWMNNGCVNVMGNGDAYAYKAGYRRGAEVLIGYVGESARDQDFLVYPIIFLYRHHVELMLKRIIRRAPYLIDGSLSEKEKQHLDRHRLD
jgi:hypothetical protein